MQKSQFNFQQFRFENLSRFLGKDRTGSIELMNLYEFMTRLYIELDPRPFKVILSSLVAAPQCRDGTVWFSLNGFWEAACSPGNECRQAAVCVGGEGTGVM